MVEATPSIRARMPPADPATGHAPRLAPGWPLCAVSRTLRFDSWGLHSGRLQSRGRQFLGLRISDLVMHSIAYTLGGYTLAAYSFSAYQPHVQF